MNVINTHTHTRTDGRICGLRGEGTCDEQIESQLVPMQVVSALILPMH